MVNKSGNYCAFTEVKFNFLTCTLQPNLQINWFWLIALSLLNLIGTVRKLTFFFQNLQMVCVDIFSVITCSTFSFLFFFFFLLEVLMRNVEIGLSCFFFFLRQKKGEGFALDILLPL